MSSHLCSSCCLSPDRERYHRKLPPVSLHELQASRIPLPWKTWNWARRLLSIARRGSPHLSSHPLDSRGSLSLQPPKHSHRLVFIPVANINHTVNLCCTLLSFILHIFTPSHVMDLSGRPLKPGTPARPRSRRKPNLQHHMLTDPKIGRAHV